MIGGKIKCVGRSYYRVVMDDGKLFNIVYSEFDYLWAVYAGKESSPDDNAGEFKSLKEAKQALVDDIRHRVYADHKSVWYGTKWGLVFDSKDKVFGIWRGDKPEGWHYNHLMPSWLEKKK